MMYSNEESNISWNRDVLNSMSILSFWLGIRNYSLNKQQVSNDEISRHLETQDNILKEEVELYLKQIIIQNNEILKLLKGGKQTMHKYYIDKIIKNGTNDQMKKLEDIMIDTISYMKELDKTEYENIECELYEIAEGRVLNEEKAKKIINRMKPYGMHWTFEEAEQVRRNNNLSTIKPLDFWVVMNMAYNDYHSLFDEDIEMYVKYSKAFILDEDAEEDKVYTYFTEIPKK